MTANWFAHCKTSEEIKEHYRQLCKQHHPDMPGGDTATMQEINVAYAVASTNAKRQEKPGWTEAQYVYAAEVDELVRIAIEEIITLPGLDIEICGLWVWVGGNTREHKDALKEAGYKWAPKKMKWYFAGIPANGRGKMDMDEIRSRYGSQRIASKQDDEQPKRRIPLLAYAD
jgi:curved DNA-binding protein CbpA